MSELNHENLNGAVILWKFDINDILSHTLVSAYGFSLSRILPYFPLFTSTLPYWSETVGRLGGEQSWMTKNSQRQDYDLAVMRKRGL